VIIDPTLVSPSVSYRLMTGVIVPRPIALVSTISADGLRNLAPFSFFNGVCGEPPVVCFAPSYREPPKDTLANIRATGEFVISTVTETIAEQMNACSGAYAPDVDEFTVSGLTPVASDVVRPARVLESPVNLECRLLQVVEVSTSPMGGSLVLGEIVRFHIDDRLVEDLRIDQDALRAVGRMGGFDYARTRDRFRMVRPTV